MGLILAAFAEYRIPMDPLDPLDAQQIVVAYMGMLERDVEHGAHPGRLDALPYAKPIVKTAIETSVRELAASGRMTVELLEYFETAYTFLAEYLEAELVDLVTQYRASAEQLTSGSQNAGDKLHTSAWRTVAETGRLAGEVARATTIEAEELRREFHSFLSPAVRERISSQRTV